jgi:Flp pilus assembly protein TadG
MSSLAVFILAMPALIAVFGYGFDTLRLVYVKESLQGTLNRATQAGVSQTVSYTAERVDANGNTVEVSVIGLEGGLDGNFLIQTPGTESAAAVAYRFYKWNTEKMRENNILECATAPGLPPSATQVKGTTGNGYNDQVLCGGTITYDGKPLTSNQLCAPLNESNSPKYGLRYTTTETVSAAFLRIVGIQNHYIKDLESVSYVRGAGC